MRLLGSGILESCFILGRLGKPAVGFGKPLGFQLLHGTCHTRLIVRGPRYELGAPTQNNSQNQSCRSRPTR